MFLGQYQHSLDEKGRLMIPARYRELLAAGAFITQGFDKCLMVMTGIYFGQVYDRINAMNLADPTARRRNNSTHHRLVVRCVRQTFAE